MVVVSVAVVVGLLLAFWPPTTPRLPQVNLLRLSRAQRMAPSLSAEPMDWSTGSLFGDPQEELSAEFEIRNPKGSGVLLSNDEVDIEYQGPKGGWTAAVSKDALIKLKDLFPDSSATYQISMKRVQACIPADAKRCRLVIFIRPPTIQERCRECLARSGFWRRFPKASVWFSDQLANTKHWREWRPEIDLP
jgi:hypothetical protein